MLDEVKATSMCPSCLLSMFSMEPTSPVVQTQPVLGKAKSGLEGPQAVPLTLNLITKPVKKRVTQESQVPRVQFAS